MMFRNLMAASALMALPISALAQDGEMVPEVDFLTWPAAKYSHYAETSNYVAEQWEKLGLKVNINPVAFPNPMLSLWFKEHKFDAVLSSLSGNPLRLEPDFFTNSQFNSANSAPGNWNVGEYSNPMVDKLGEKQLGIYDAQERRKVIYALQEELYNDPPEAIVTYAISTHAINSDNMEIGGFEASPEGIRANANIMRMKSKHGGAVRIGWTVDYTTLNPLVASTNEDLTNLALIYDKLVVLAPDGSPRMWLAQSIDVVDDLTVDVTMRKGHTFSDGEPVTPEDVKFTFEYMKKWESAYFTKYLEKVDSVSVVDDTTIRFTLNQPYAPFVMNTLGQVYVLPQHVWGTLVDDLGIEKPQDFANDRPVGSGPYTVKYRKEGQEMYLSARKDHYGDPQSDILSIVYGSAEVVMQSLRKGEIDASFQPVVPITIDEYRGLDNIKLYEAKSNGYNSVRYKVTGPVFWNKDLRRALAHAVPYDAIINDIFGGLAAASGSSIVPVNAYWHNPALKPPVFDLDLARQMLTDAGFTWDDDGRLHFPPK